MTASRTTQGKASARRISPSRARRIPGIALCGLLLCCAIPAFSGCTQNSPHESETVSVEADTSENTSTHNVGETATIRVRDSSSNDGVNVLATLEACGAASALPEGASAFREEGEAGDNQEVFLIDESGAINDGWFLVNATLTFSNENDAELKLNVGSMQLEAFDGNGSQIPIPYASEPIWFEPGKKLSQDRYSVNLPAHSSSTYGISFVARNDLLDGNKILLVVDKKRIGLETKDIQAFDISFLKGAKR